MGCAAGKTPPAQTKSSQSPLPGSPAHLSLLISWAYHARIRPPFHLADCPKSRGHLYLFDPVQRQVVQILAAGHPGQQAGRGKPAVNDGRRHRGGLDGLAGAAGILRPDVADDEEAGRLDIQLLADILTDLDQLALAVIARTRLRLMTDIHALQVRRQGLATGLGARRARGLAACRGGGFQFGGHRCQVLIDIILEQRPLLRRQGLTLDAEAGALELRQFQSQLLVLERQCLKLPGLLGVLLFQSSMLLPEARTPRGTQIEYRSAQA